ncbi:hypothetical protein Salat_0192900 [Sesamum alatum]|uniref:Uncharacterized protein n=1 Tax=Sesamum alatum TaxID=300844 RepID=A0AAE1YY33_9LAMI|nr:hypothetical protein Salat_0192900 [Sesamum alatum]
MWPRRGLPKQGTSSRCRIQRQTDWGCQAEGIKSSRGNPGSPRGRHRGWSPRNLCGPPCPGYSRWRWMRPRLHLWLGPWTRIFTWVTVPLQQGGRPPNGPRGKQGRRSVASRVMRGAANGVGALV